MQDRPTATELLATLAEYLEDELMPALEGPLGYRTRVAANLLRILEREQSLGAAALQRERALLCDLLGADSQALQPGSLAEQVAELNRRVASAIDDHHIDHQQAWNALMEISRAKIAIIRPGYDAWDAAGELP
ncbi:MAG: DUF6285 domain-containing protein [Pseudomonadales bacterium]